MRLDKVNSSPPSEVIVSQEQKSDVRVSQVEVSAGSEHQLQSAALEDNV